MADSNTTVYVLKVAGTDVLCHPTATFSDIDHFLRRETCGEKSYFGEHMSQMRLVISGEEVYTCITNPAGFYQVQCGASPSPLIVAIECPLRLSSAAQADLHIQVCPLMIDCQFSNAFGDGARLGWDCSLSGSPLTGTPSSNCRLLYTYDLGSGSVTSVPFAGERDVAWHGEAKVQWAEDLEKPPKRQIKEESGGSKAKKAKTEDGAAAAADGDSTKDNFIGKAFPMLEQQILQVGLIVEFGFGAGFSKDLPTLSCFNEGGNVAEEEWGGTFHDCVVSIEHNLRESEYVDRLGNEPFDPLSHEALPGTLDELFPSLVAWVKKKRPERYAQIGQRPTEPFVSLLKGNPRRKSPKLVWSHPRQPKTLTEIFYLLEGAAATTK
eukprot:m.160495 g.160495  ORF g.160495 m.160495 type:complete len:380 (+) comp14556_c1_seq5:1282-2421(+)